ncbi:cell division protein FtsI (penicillin-binding protein 3) [Cryobacterium mesophilum]|nr:penicillin-binding protein 2 [Terrimesophilobacter mesophilus]MBB5632050.1 cell division protein FtsI (penicillin-binding protein 3) [Terrimesophilobacter mesophilus]
MNHQRSTRRRLAIAVVLTFAMVAVFVVRLVDIQVVRAADFNAESLNKRAIELTVSAPRGEIVDENGVVLADSVTRYDITASPRNALPFKRTEKDGSTREISVFDAVSEIAALTGTKADDLLLDVTSDPASDWTMLVKAVDTDTFRAIRDLKIPWIYPQPRPHRTYPLGSVAGNLVGFVGTDGPQNGLEATSNSCLASTDGTSTYERGADGVRIPGSTVTTKEAVPGGTLQLTIDSDLQWYVQQAIAEQAISIGAESAMAGVVRVKDGHIMALADYPSVDPNNVNGTKTAFLGSRAFAYSFEPGSIMKAVTASMLINEGVASPTTRVTVPEFWVTPDGARIRDATYHGPMHWTLTGVLEQSSNVGMSMLGSRLPGSVRYDYLRKYGFGDTTPIHFQGEADGILAKHWNTQQNYDTTYGQGVSVTLVQMLSAFQGIANGGMRLPLTLVEGCTKPDGTVVDLPSTQGTRVVSEKAATTTVKALESVVTGGWLSSELSIPGYRIAAKTGTAEVALPTGGYGNDYIVSVAGIAPADNPQYVVIVTYVKPKIMKTSAAAAPTFHKIMAQVLKTYRVPPSKKSGPGYPTTW